MRISIGGGGTDLPSYYRQFGGFVISRSANTYTLRSTATSSTAIS
jgi:D-glycero-alpha-D-manno-heptose-7-phosphate kinase